MSKSSFDYMRAVFRVAIPDITTEAILFFVHTLPYKAPDGSPVEFKRYIIPGPTKSVFEFSIARMFIAGVETVFVLRIPDERIPEDQRGGDFYIMQYIPEEKV